MNAVERLCYIGSRGLGALEFAPVTGPRPTKSKPLDVDALVGLANDILHRRETFAGTLGTPDQESGKVLRDILAIGTSAGGARAKAIIAWNPATNEVRSGQVTADDGFEYWLLKFDGVAANKDKELADPEGYTVIEYAYAQMANAAGIDMSECRLLDENGRRHFMTRRFDRTTAGGKWHMQSLAAMQHWDFNAAGAYSYEGAMLSLRTLGMGLEMQEALFRRAVFNVLARNQDDHVKNIAFLMDQAGGWRLSPAFDMTYSYNPHGAWTHQHQMSINGKRDGFGIADLTTLGAMLKRGRARDVIEEVRAAVKCWPAFAEAAGVRPQYIVDIANTLRTNIA